MWHEVVLALADDAPSTDPGTFPVVGILGALATLVVAISALMTTLQGFRRRRDTAPATAHPVPLNSDTVTDGHTDAKDARIAALETFLTRRHFDPNAIVHGKEDPADVRFD